MTLDEYLTKRGFTKTEFGYTAEIQTNSKVIINGQPMPSKSIKYNLKELGNGSIDDTETIFGYRIEIDDTPVIDVWSGEDNENFFNGII